MSAAQPGRHAPPSLPVTDRELLDASAVAALISRTRNTVVGWNRRGLMPEPVRVEGSVLWRRRELLDWIDAKCPVRNAWRWRPGHVVTVERFVRLLEEESERLAVQVREARELLARGQKTIELRRAS